MGVETMGNSFPFIFTHQYLPLQSLDLAGRKLGPGRTKLGPGRTKLGPGRTKLGPGRDKTNMLFSYRYFSSTFIVYHTISNFDRNV